MGFHCTDCLYSAFALNEESGLYQGAGRRGATRAHPHRPGSPARHIAERPADRGPAVDPYGAEYLRTSNVCGEFRRPHDVSHDRRV